MTRLPLLLFLGLSACGSRSAPSVRAPDNHAPPGGATCVGAEIVRAPGGAKPFASWTDAWRGLRVDPDAADPPTPPASEADARAKLCGQGGCEAPGPWLLADLDEDPDVATEVDVAFPEGAGLLVYPKVGEGMGGRCQWSDDVEVVAAAAGAPIQVTVHHLFSDMIEEEGGHESCFYTEASNDDLFFDPSGTLLLRVHRDGRAPPGEDDGDGGVELADDEFTFDVSVAATGRTVTLAGGGCDQTIDL